MIFTEREKPLFLTKGDEPTVASNRRSLNSHLDVSGIDDSAALSTSIDSLKIDLGNNHENDNVAITNVGRWGVEWPS